MFLTKKIEKNMFNLSLAVEMNYLFLCIHYLQSEILAEACAHKNFSNHIFHSLHKSNNNKNSKAYCLQIFLNMLFGSTNSLVKKIDKNSANIYKSPTNFQSD